MDDSYDIRSWSTHYREDRLRQARALRLEGRLRMARSVTAEGGTKGGEGPNDVALRTRIAALVAALFLSATGATLAASALAGEHRAASARVAQELGLSTANTGNSQNTG